MGTEAGARVTGAPGTLPGDSPDTTSTAALDSLPTTRREILLAIKRCGEARAEDIATELSITVSGVRQHLTGLAAQGLVNHREVKDGPGRPKYFFQLTPRGESLFPRRYAQLTHQMIEFLGEEDPELVRRLFARRTSALLERARARVTGETLAERIASLASMLDEDGYLANVEHLEDGSFLLVEHNCAVLDVATRHPEACSGELELLDGLLPDAVVERTTHIASGDPGCAYRITPRQV